MPSSTGSFYNVASNDTSKGYAIAAAHASYKYYNNMTIVMWVASYPGNNKHIFSNWEQVSGNTRAWLMSTQTDGAVRMLASWDGTSFSNMKTAAGVLDGSWKCIAWTFASGTFGLYINGSSASITTTTAWTGGAVAMFSANVQCMIGGHSPSAPPADTSDGGCKSSFMLVNKVLNSTEMTELYNNGTPLAYTSYSFSANVTNYWEMNQNSSTTTLVDSVTSSANMTITESGTSGNLNPSANYPRQNTSPGIAHVETGTSWVYEGDVLNGTYTGANRWSDPNVINVLSGVTYQANSLTNNKTGTLVSPTAAQVATAVWDELTSAHSTTGSFGKLLKDDLDATVSSRLAASSYTAPPSAATITSAVWDEPTSSHTTSGSFGVFIKKLLTVAKFLGLK